MANPSKLTKSTLKVFADADRTYQGTRIGTNSLNFDKHYGLVCNLGLVEAKSEGSPFVVTTARGKAVLAAGGAL